MAIVLDPNEAGSRTLESRLVIPVGQTMHGSQLYAWSLRQLGMDKVLTYIGGPIIKIIESIKEEAGIEVLIGPDEVDIGHIAEGYYRVTKRPLNVLFTSGVALKVVSPLEAAKCDGTSMIVTVGQVPYDELNIGNEWFQSARIVEPFREYAKWTYRIPSADMIQSALKTAYHAATTGRPGPVLLEISADISQNQTAILKNMADLPLIRVRQKKPKVYSLVHVEKSNLDSLMEDMAAAERPVFMPGGGVHQAGGIPNLVRCAEMTDTPMVPTLMILGSLNKGNSAYEKAVMKRLNLGMGGMHGSLTSQLAPHNSDFIVGIGNRFDNRVHLNVKEFAPDAKIYWINPHYPGISRTIAERVKKIDMDAAKALEILVSQGSSFRHDRWINQIALWREKYKMPDSMPRQVIQLVRKFTKIYEPMEPYVTTGVGAHQMFLAQFWNFYAENGRNMLLTSGSLAPMGIGLPFGIGALLAEPHRPVYVFNGDGSAVMDIRSLLMGYYLKERLGQYSNGVKEIIFRDNSLGMVRTWQNNMFKERIHATDLSDMIPPEYFEGQARSTRFEYFKADYVNRGVDNRRIIEQFVKHRGNAILEVVILPAEPLPMTPGAKSVKDSILPYGQRIDPADLMVGKNWHLQQK